MVGPPRLPDWGSVVACSTPKPVTMVIIMHVSDAPISILASVSALC